MTTPQALPRVLVVDDHKMIRDSIVMLAQMQQGFNVVGHAGDGYEAIEKAAELQPDIILMDIHMPLMNGLEATKQILANNQTCKIIALTMINEGEQYLNEMFKAGAMGYLVKSVGMNEIMTAIEMVMAGMRYISREMAQTLIDKSVAKSQSDNPLDQKEIAISKRELEALKLIARGLTNRQIAEELSISIRTVENHRHNILTKTNSKNTAALVAYAVERKWI